MQVQRGAWSIRVDPCTLTAALAAPLVPLLQRLLKDCEEKAEAARRPSQQQLAPAPGAPTGPQRRAPGGHSPSSGSDEETSGDSDGSVGDGAPVARAPAAAPAPAPAATAAGNGTAGSSSADHSSDDADAGGSSSGNEFVPNLDKLKKLGKRSGPGAQQPGVSCLSASLF